MDVENFKAVLEARRQAQIAADKLVKKQGKKFIQLMTADLFEKYPKLEFFSWQQGEYYDDQSYNYSVANDAGSLVINGENAWAQEEEDEEWAGLAADDIEEALGALDSSDYESLFGTAKIVITKNSLVLESFEG